jgi:hypothetical protein
VGGRHVSVGGCADLADTVADYVRHVDVSGCT